MTNYVFLGDSPTLETGFARVTKNLIPKLKLPNKKVWGLGYDGLDHDFDFKIYPANLNSSWHKDSSNIQRFKDFILSLDGEVVLWTIHDSWRLNDFSEVIREIRLHKKLKLVSYIPVDSNLLKQDADFISLIDVPVAYNSHGKTEIEKATSKAVFSIPHGNDKSFYKKEVNREMIFPNSSDKILIGNVNTNSSRKNLLRTLEIFKHLSSIDGRFNIYLHCAADGFFDLKRIAFDMGVLDKVVFGDPFFQNSAIGKTDCSKKLLVDIYNCFDLFLTTSISEGWGLTATEAASCEVPLFLPRHTSFESIFSEDSCTFLDSNISGYYMGKVVPDLIPQEAAIKIIESLNDSEGILNKTRNAKNLVDSFDWDLIAEEWTNILKNV